mmetsp:Transcript_80948/g.262347  ORF Transcript_80948/g.262347 Transcript_80948/m.262347 type:complete len:100 (+) Transcript_80948:369-668(+)
MEDSPLAAVALWTMDMLDMNSQTGQCSSSKVDDELISDFPQVAYYMPDSQHGFLYAWLTTPQLEDLKAPEEQPQLKAWLDTLVAEDASRVEKDALCENV